MNTAVSLPRSLCPVLLEALDLAAEQVVVLSDIGALASSSSSAE